MARKSNPALQLVKTIIILFFLFQLVRAFIPPDLNGITFETAPWTDLEDVLFHMDEFIDQPVCIESVRVSDPAYFYFGSLFYLESMETGSRIMVLSREYPPKAGTIISILGVVRPVIAIDKINLAFFKPAAWIEQDKKEAETGLEAHLHFKK